MPLNLGEWPAEQWALADRFIQEQTSREEAKKIVRRAAARKPTSKGGGAKGKSAKLPNERTLKTPSETKVRVAMREGFDVLAWVEALREALVRAEAKLEPAEQGAEQDAA